MSKTDVTFLCIRHCCVLGFFYNILDLQKKVCIAYNLNNSQQQHAFSIQINCVLIKQEYDIYIFLVKGQLWPSPCRLSGTIPFEAHFSGQKCKGNFSDWNENTCTYNTFVTMTDNCSGKTMESRKILCHFFSYVN